MVFVLDADDVEYYKKHTLDRILSELITANLIVEQARHDEVRRKAMIDAAKPIIERELNPTILDIIFSTDPLFWHDRAPPPKEWHKAIKRMDQITKALGDLIYFAYKESIDGKTKGQKVVGCYNAILGYINGVAFYRELQSSAAGPDVKFVKLRKDFLRNSRRR